jgi:hypothetical protein
MSSFPSPLPVFASGFGLEKDDAKIKKKIEITKER